MKNHTKFLTNIFVITFTIGVCLFITQANATLIDQGDYFIDDVTGYAWYENVAQFINMDYTTQQGVISGLTTGGLTWVMADVNALQTLSSYSVAELDAYFRPYTVSGLYTWGRTSTEGTVGNHETWASGTLSGFQAGGETPDTNVDASLGAFAVSLGAPLPVELSSFHAEVVKEGVKLHWSTAAEINNAGFNLYKDGQLLTFVNGNGTSNEAHEYSYLDINVEQGKLYTYQIEDIEEDTGVATRHPAISVIAGKGMVNDNDTPVQYALKDNYPNPFNPTTTVSFDLPESANLSLAIYDAAGKLIKSFADGEMWNGGSYSVVWNGKDDMGDVVSSGTYFCKMVTEKYSETKSMVLLK